VSVSIAASENFACRLEATAARFPERTALAWAGGRMTHEELHRRAGAFARALDASGVRAGDRVALMLPNGWRFAVALLGALKLGATVAPLHPRLTGDEVAAIVTPLAPRHVVREVTAGDGAWAARTPLGSPALVLFTSGSTGRPKGAVLSHRALAWAVQSWADPIMRLREDDVVLGVLPFAHSYGLNGALLAPLLAGASVLVLERFSPEAVVAAIEESGVTVFPGVATMFRRVLDAPVLAAGRLAPLRIALSGAAPCPWPLAREWRERTGVRILRGYGMTELFRPISYLAGDDTEVPDAIGRAVPGVELRLVDDAGRALPVGESGELLIRTPGAMDGYLDAPDETRRVLVDGWFATGDLACVSPEGWVTITGRKKDVILRGGYTISPQEVEAVLLTHPAVAEAAVAGLPHAELGEDVVAYVVLRRPAAVEELVAHCRERLAAYKCPRHVKILDSLPRTTTGKVLRARLI
jgi:long-chain acyl-CoA synthetase